MESAGVVALGCCAMLELVKGVDIEPWAEVVGPKEGVASTAGMGGNRIEAWEENNIQNRTGLSGPGRIGNMALGRDMEMLRAVLQWGKELGVVEEESDLLLLLPGWGFGVGQGELQQQAALVLNRQREPRVLVPEDVHRSVRLLLAPQQPRQGKLVRGTRALVSVGPAHEEWLRGVAFLLFVAAVVAAVRVAAVRDSARHSLEKGAIPMREDPNPRTFEQEGLFLNLSHTVVEMSVETWPCQQHGTDRSLGRFRSQELSVCPVRLQSLHLALHDRWLWPSWPQFLHFTFFFCFSG